MCLYDSEGVRVPDCYSYLIVTLEVSHLHVIENETVKILGKPYSAENMCYQWIRIERKSQLNSLAAELLVYGTIFHNNIRYILFRLLFATILSYIISR